MNRRCEAPWAVCLQLSAANCAGIRKSLLAVRVQAGRASGCFDGGGSPPRDLHELMHGRTPEFPGAHCPLPVVVCPCAVACGDVAINNSGNSFGAEAWQWHHPCRDTAVYQIAVSWQRLGPASISALGSSVYGPFRGRSCFVAKLRRLPSRPTFMQVRTCSGPRSTTRTSSAKTLEEDTSGCVH